MKALEWVNEYSDDYDEDILLVDEFAEALLGIGMRFTDRFAIYDYDKCIEILVRDGCTEEEAVEHFDYNVLGAYMAGIPCFLVRPPSEEVRENGK